MKVLNEYFTVECAWCGFPIHPPRLAEPWPSPKRPAVQCPNCQEWTGEGGKVNVIDLTNVSSCLQCARTDSHTHKLESDR